MKIAEAGSAAVAQGSSAANEGLRTVNLISLHPQSDWAIAKDYILSAAAENVRNSLSAPNAEGCNPAPKVKGIATDQTEVLRACRNC